eukprot:GFYU01000123.1.p1 GENE.GFYU01000123.1~~GFYU01000123.1.p1  ORF type:complete len:227 (+),score=73.10 GFYU01000123.1:30-683(+)
MADPEFDNTDNRVDDNQAQGDDEEVDESQKHPLQNAWTLWYDSPKKRVSQHAWADQLKKISTVKTVEDFWCLWNNIRVPTRLNSGSNYHFFKDGVEPKWEDSQNKKGGKWIIHVPKPKSKDSLDDLWLHTVLAAIGETFEDGDEILGVVVSMRKGQDKLAVWTRTAAIEDVQMRIGKMFKQIATGVGLQSQVLGYQSHSESIVRNSSFNNNNLYEVQ